MTLFLTIDVEDWFQVENLKSVISSEDWDDCDVRVKGNVDRILKILDSFETNATFFVLGWLADRYPSLVRKIHERGHEVASHGYAHKLVHHQKPDEFEEDISMSKKILENIIGDKVLGYRAPSFSITDWAIEIIKEVGYKYDSSFMPATLSMNRRYGKLGHGGNKGLRIEGVRIKGETGQPPRRGQREQFPYLTPFRFPNGLWEFPVGVLEVDGKTIPWGGGFYFRFLSYWLFRVGLRKIQKRGKGCYVFYLHPWELDPRQPRVKEIRWDYQLRQYWGLKKTEGKLKKLLRDFEFESIERGLKGRIKD